MDGSAQPYGLSIEPGGFSDWNLDSVAARAGSPPFSVLPPISHDHIECSRSGASEQNYAIGNNFFHFDFGQGETQAVSGDQFETFQLDTVPTFEDSKEESIEDTALRLEQEEERARTLEKLRPDRGEDIVTHVGIDRDTSGNYDPEEEKRKLRRQRRQNLREPDDLTAEDRQWKKAEKWNRVLENCTESNHTNCCYVAKIKVSPSKLLKITGTDPGSWEENANICFRRKQADNNYYSNVVGEHNIIEGSRRTHKHADSDIAEDVPDNGNPSVRGCWGCHKLGLNDDPDRREEWCSLISDNPVWPCQHCLELGEDCEMIRQPALRRSCNRCITRKVRCSFVTDPRARGPCRCCMDLEVRCIAGPTSNGIPKRVSYDYAPANSPRDSPMGSSTKMRVCTNCLDSGNSCSLWAKPGRVPQDRFAPCSACKSNGLQCNGAGIGHGAILNNPTDASDEDAYHSDSSFLSARVRGSKKTKRRARLGGFDEESASGASTANQFVPSFLRDDALEGSRERARKQARLDRRAKRDHKQAPRAERKSSQLSDVQEHVSQEARDRWKRREERRANRKRKGLPATESEDSRMSLSDETDEVMDCSPPKRRKRPSNRSDRHTSVNKKGKAKAAKPHQQAKLSHPIKFNVDSDPVGCSFCKHPAYALFGKTDSSGKLPVTSTQLCSKCTMDRFRIIACDKHELVRVRNLDETVYERIVDEIVRGVATDTDLWCSLCPAMALYECQHDSGISTQGAGCGLKLCEGCYQEHGLKILSGTGFISGIPEGPTPTRFIGLRADTMLLRPMGPLVKFMLGTYQ